MSATRSAAAVRRVAAALVLVLAGATAAMAQSSTQWDSLYDRIIRLEHKLRALEGGTTLQQPSTTNLDPASSASQSLRIDQVEADLRTLLGQVQNLAYQVQQLNEQLKRFSEDAEYRLQQLESGDRSQLKQPNKRTANNDALLPDYGDLTSLEQYPQEPTGQDVEEAPGTQVLGTIPGSSLDNDTYGTQTLDSQTYDSQSYNTQTYDSPSSDTQSYDDTTTLSAVPDEVTSQPLDDASAVSGADDLYKAAYTHLLKRRFGAAESGFTKFLKSHRKHKLAGNAQYWLGESYYARGRYKQAAQAFLSGYRDFSSSPKAPDSMLKLGMSLRQLGQKKHACATFKQLSERYPRASANLKKIAARERKRAGCG